MFKNFQISINKCVVRGMGIPNYSNALTEHQHMYLQNKYTTWYYNIVHIAQSRLTQPDYVERHHIIPKSLGGTNENTNIVKLSAREHFVCHWLLTKMVVGDNRSKMIFAFHRMFSSSKLQERYSNGITPRIYEKLKIVHSQCMRDVKTGSKLSDTHKENIRKGLLGKNKGKTLSIEHKNRLKEINTGKTYNRSTEHKSKLSAALTGKNVGKVRTPEQKAAMSARIKLWWAKKKETL
jgi:hypothetical protein